MFTLNHNTTTERATIARLREGMNLARALYSLHKAIAAKARKAGDYAKWSAHMKHCKTHKASLRFEILRLHWALVAAGKTATQPSRVMIG